jgi:hypothetical protein
MTTHTSKIHGLSQKARLLQLLENYKGKWVKTTTILSKVYGGSHLGIARAGARVFDLRKDGFDIETKRVSPTVWAYRLV